MSNRYQNANSTEAVRSREESSGYRQAVRIGLVVLLALAVAITIAPQVVLTGIAVVADSARDFAQNYQSAASLVGLVAVAATGIGLWMVFRPRRAGMATMSHIGSESPSTAHVGEEVEGGETRRAS